jgi:PIN domain nuclease of toxin-antitoxin system
VKLLADTHVVLWSLLAPERLGREASAAMRDPDNELLASAASVWEIAIKAATGKLRLPGPVPSWLLPNLARSEYTLLAITAAHAAAVADLPLHHRDPFDRLLVAQALAEGAFLVTKDARLSAYGAPVLTA